MNKTNKRTELWRTVKFTLISISAGLIQIGSFAILHDVLHLEEYWQSYLPSLVLSVLWNFTINRKVTFRSDAPIARSMLLVALYYLVFTPLTSWTGQLMSNAGVHDWLVEAINMLLNFVTEFLYQRFVVYRGMVDTAVSKPEEAKNEP